ncbi:2-succinyl-6-hydroxy-2,4-cyclohexadiene-1-carboxylate synthase [Lusitaniella coriacea]|uniref:2-succinyl-6-hydroxy-2, 4-cyclohexadiene-1-carboxylate synthase n=1 Tax=Lusitaniella coriacea TaxID=1983105 RepID=UPI001D14BADF|nr:2-succinyl-6-hydroxy-2,4-cyclohexadiene-1-carboxylate synthase [Lusitaniella coriacea]
MHYSKIDFKDYQFSYSLYGEPTQPRILFLHGFMGSGTVFEPIISQLRDRFYCLTVDLPGHGKTRIIGSSECYTMENTASALIQLLNRLEFPPCFLVGYSMGGRLGLYLALHYPQYFPKVFLESTSPGLKTEKERKERREKDFGLARQLVTGNLELFLSHWYNQPLFNSLPQHPEFHQLLERRLQNDPIGLARSLTYLGTGSQPSLWDKLQDYPNPLLLMVGEFDPKFRAINKEIRDRAPAARLYIAEGCGHNIHFENPELFARAIARFFSESSN